MDDLETYHGDITESSDLERARANPLHSLEHFFH
jgi:hypothetical protein